MKTYNYVFTVNCKQPNSVNQEQHDAITFHLTTKDNDPIETTTAAEIYAYDEDEPMIEIFGLHTQSELVAIFQSISIFLKLHQE